MVMHPAVNRASREGLRGSNPLHSMKEEEPSDLRRWAANPQRAAPSTAFASRLFHAGLEGYSVGASAPTAAPWPSW